MALLVIVLFGRVLLRPLFRLVATAGSTELFIAAALFVYHCGRVIAEQAHLSMALGAFVAGLLLAETEYRKAVEATVAPFKVCCSASFSSRSHEHRFPRTRTRAAVAARQRRQLDCVESACAHRTRQAFSPLVARCHRDGLLLGPGGEFAFVGIGMAAAAGLVEPQLASFTLAVTAVTMALTPLLSIGGATSRRGLVRAKPSIRNFRSGRQADSGTPSWSAMGRGKVVCALLKQNGIPYIAADSAL